jgi:hypothetical protein
MIPSKPSTSRSHVCISSPTIPASRIGLSNVSTVVTLTNT